MKRVLYAAAAAFLTLLARWQLFKADGLRAAAEWCDRKARGE